MIKLKTFAFLAVLFLCYTSSCQMMVRTTNGGYITHEAIHENASPEDFESLNELIAKSDFEFNNENLVFKQNIEFGMPIRSSGNSFMDNTEYFYGVSKYYDHNSSINFKDFNCGGLTYNGHSGTDYVGFPFYWYQYEMDLLDVVAVEDGVILAKVDGRDECSSRDGYGNYIIISHGSDYFTQYSHMKMGTLDYFEVNSIVKKGDVIAKVGTSGNSTGPHLHFHPYRVPYYEPGVEFTAEEIFDPYESLTCQVSSTEPRMIRKADKEYMYTNILSVTTHSDVPVWKMSCDDSTEEDPKFKNIFKPNDRVYFVVAIRDMLPGQTIVTTLYNPSGQTVDVKDEDATVLAITGQAAHSSLLFKLDDILIPDGAPNGEWELVSVITNTQDGQLIEGLTLSHKFTVDQTSGINEFKEEGFMVYPNPCLDKVSVVMDYSLINEGSNLAVEILNITGQKFENIQYQKNSRGFDIDVSLYSKGVYFLIINDLSSNKRFYQKLIKG